MARGICAGGLYWVLVLAAEAVAWNVDRADGPDGKNGGGMM